MRRRSQVSFGLSLAAIWIAFAVIHVSMTFIAPQFEATLSDIGAVMPTLSRLAISMAGMYVHLLVAIASTALVLWYQMKVEEAERRHLAAVGVLFFTFLWTVMYSAALYLPWAVLVTPVGG